MGVINKFECEINRKYFRSSLYVNTYSITKTNKLPHMKRDTIDLRDGQIKKL